ncbi:serine hydrolase domain-containing protein [Aspergillus affinis]|uniref:serine hydrolase domain-containing protein n=1 Tax=Aspergillus affinis TaxID=1070780 RepID=UPI0022FF287D|nr:beta-lactamase family protein [Aspergillus affinis]KAI9037559.1 beta-lactamase family protein [Aspergillus affinis]
MAENLSSRKLNAAVAKIDEATRGPNPKVPGIVCVVVDQNGDSILSHASGFVGLNGQSPMTLDTVSWLASCTKLLTGIACLQLVEQGRLALDEAAQLDRLALELKERKVLTKDSGDRYRLVPQERAITLRMLMTHTSGFGYALMTWIYVRGRDQSGWMTSPAGRRMSCSDCLSFNREQLFSMALALIGLGWL